MNLRVYKLSTDGVTNRTNLKPWMWKILRWRYKYCTLWPQLRPFKLKVFIRDELEKGFDKQLSDLAQIEKYIMHKRKEKETVQNSLALYFCSARKDNR